VPTGNETIPSFAEEPPIPEKLGLPAAASRRWGEDRPAGRAAHEPYKTHLAYVRERRSDADGSGDPGRGASEVRKLRTGA